MNFNNDEEELEYLNRLLERLHQAGFGHNGSPVQFVYVAKGAQYVDKIETQYVGKTYPAPNPTPQRSGELPDVLRTPEAMVLWEKAQRAGYVDARYQPLLSRTQAALLADAMAERLGIKEKWKVFEALWHRKYMRSDYNLALSQQQSYEFQDELKRLFG